VGVGWGYILTTTKGEVSKREKERKGEVGMPSEDECGESGEEWKGVGRAC
jgi:hypothetical protein